MEIEEYAYDGSDNHRWAFQGQEKEEELFDGNGSFYKYRINDARIGRFFAVDPLAHSYPWNSQYAFSENRVVDGIELEGLEVIPINGTFHNSNTDGQWGVLDKDNWAPIYSATGNNSTNMNAGAWNGFDLAIHRKTGAAQIAENIIKLREMKCHEPLTLIGHSHGGNVAMEVANILTGKGYTVDYLITINTPVRTKENSNNIYDLSDETRKSGIKHLHIAHEKDYVVQEYGGDSDIKMNPDLLWYFMTANSYDDAPPLGWRDNTNRMTKGTSWTGEFGPSDLLFRDESRNYDFNQLLHSSPSGNYSYKATTLANDKFHNSQDYPIMWENWLYDAINKSSSVNKTSFNTFPWYNQSYEKDYHSEEWWNSLNVEH